MTVTTDQAQELLVDCLKSQLPVMLHGSPGIGKSSIIKEIANDFGLKLIDIRLSQCDPTDINGFPSIDHETHKSRYAPMEMFPLLGETVESGYSGYLIFLDEFNSAPTAVQAAAYRLVLDREVGQYKLHDKALIVCAGNKDTDGAITNRLSTAMQSRLVHLEIAPDHESWLKWATTKGDIDYRVKAYINFKPDNLYRFDPDHSDKTFACYRTWDFVSRLIKKWPNIDRSKLPLLAGTISEGIAREFITFCDIFTDLITVDQIIANPTGVKVPDEPGTLYALSGSIGNHAKPDTIDKLMEFVNRLPIEFQIITLREIASKHPTITSSTAVRTWLSKNAQELF
jgi:hypothetical protein